MVTFESMAAAAGAVGEAKRAVTIGVFDGVHLGHARVLDELVRRASASRLRSCVLTFRHHPEEVLFGRAPSLLNILDHRLDMIARRKPDELILLDFTPEIASMTADEFAKDVLVAKLRASVLVLGHDARIGSRPEPQEALPGGKPEEPDRLPAACRQAGIELHRVQPVIVGGKVVSSSAVRSAIEAADFDGAAEMLGRPYTVRGEVVKGDGFGRKIGFPTANVHLPDELALPSGIFATLCTVPAPPTRNAPVPSVTHVWPPQQRAKRKPRELECHLFDFHGDLYGTTIEVAPVQKLREVAEFASAELLAKQIAADATRARELLVAGR